MNISNRDVFEKVGTLFYAIATDQRVKPIEMGELKLLISEYWLPRTSSDHVTSEESHCILMTIDSLAAENASASDAYRQFATFFSLNEYVFTKQLRERIFETASRIVKLFKADNYSSNEHFESLRKLFQVASGIKA